MVAASAGNHAQGVALAASMLGIESTIVMPAYASLPKVDATRGYGARVVLTGERIEQSLEHARELAAEKGASLIHPFDDPLIIAGQGTVGTELLDEVPEPDRVVVSIGGGGLISGMATAIKALRPEVEVIGVRPAAAPATIADGTAVKSPGEITGPIIERCVDRVVAVDEDHISRAIVAHLERTKQVVEGAGALPLAAMISGAVPADGQSVLVASGGNIDPGLVRQVIRHGLEVAGRYLMLRFQIPDRPGELQAVISLISDLQANILSVVHNRVGRTLPVQAVEVELTLETRNEDHASKVRAALESAGYNLW